MKKTVPYFTGLAMLALFIFTTSSCGVGHSENQKAVDYADYNPGGFYIVESVDAGIATLTHETSDSLNRKLTGVPVSNGVRAEDVVRLKVMSQWVTNGDSITGYFFGQKIESKAYKPEIYKQFEEEHPHAPRALLDTAIDRSAVNKRAPEYGVYTINQAMPDPMYAYIVVLPGTGVNDLHVVNMQTKENAWEERIYKVFRDTIPKMDAKYVLNSDYWKADSGGNLIFIEGFREPEVVKDKTIL